MKRVDIVHVTEHFRFRFVDRGRVHRESSHVTDVGERHFLEQRHLQAVKSDTDGISDADEPTSKGVDSRCAEVKVVDVTEV